MTTDELRELYLEFFEGKGHLRVNSSPLVPKDDPTLLFTSAGMVQFKPYFTGEAVPPNPRLTTCQKCFRTTDIDSVSDAKHLTFFEMLGNFSVGDYFKKEAIEWGWEFVTEWLKLPTERLWITIYLDDDVSFNYWRSLNVPEHKILRRGDEDNFWGPAGESGPCGPCSEIHYDLGEKFGCGKQDCSPTCDCGRFIEMWNLVFTEFNQDIKGQKTKLPAPNIDTGMGLERVAAILQGKSNVYGADVFTPIVQKVEAITGTRYGLQEEADRAIRIISEHGRGVTFLITDGVLPGNEGRGYVLRRLLRRAILFGRRLGINELFLHDVAETVVNTMSHIYPELKQNRQLVCDVINIEEKRFLQTLESGLNWLDRAITVADSRGEKVLSGEEVFKLYDTYGFPIELSSEVAREKGFTIDTDGFKEAMEQQRSRARAAGKFSLGTRTEVSVYKNILNRLNNGISSQQPCIFTGYTSTRGTSEVVAILIKGQETEQAEAGEEAEIVLRETPFYAEMGGQVGDTGTIKGSDGIMEVANTLYPLADLIAHSGKVIQGRISAGDIVEAIVDWDRRSDIARNHTATHLLQAALRSELGIQVRQSGSLVAPDRLRFDFTHISKITSEQLLKIQQKVNQWIRQNLTVISEMLTYKDAVESGATALFDEKYGDIVRMISIGEPAISRELCGGTHTTLTGDIGIFYILSESSIGASLRRIEAVTGRGAEDLVSKDMLLLKDISDKLETTPEHASEKLSQLMNEFDKERKKALALEKGLARIKAQALISKTQVINGITVIAEKVDASNMDTLREMGDLLKEKLGSAIIVLAAIWDSKPYFLAMVTKDLINKGYKAGDIVKKVGAEAGGSGGGRPEMGQAGGKDKDKIDTALRLVRTLLAK